MNKIVELYCASAQATPKAVWKKLVQSQHCLYLNRRCLKVRKSQPHLTLGTCSVLYGREPKPVVICPYRLLERRQIFVDCLHLLSLHEPGQELHIVSEVTIPGGSVDYFLVSAKNKKVIDFVGIELQTLDTTGTVWPERQRFLQKQGMRVEKAAGTSSKSYGMNWKMTAKTTLMQLHHKVQTFENFNKHLVLVIQDHFLAYMQKEFRFAHLHQARLGDAMHFHAYHLAANAQADFQLEFQARFSTDARGIAESLGLQADPKMELTEIMRLIETKLNAETLFVPTGLAV